MAGNTVGRVQTIHSPSPATGTDEAAVNLKEEYKSQIPGGYSDQIVDLQRRLRAAYIAGTLDQAAKLNFLDEVTAELSIAQERAGQLANATSPADMAARETLRADMGVLLDDRRRLDESYFDATPVGKIKSLIELAFLARAIQTLPKHIGKIANWISKLKGSKKPPVPPGKPAPPKSVGKDGVVIKLKIPSPEALARARVKMLKETLSKRKQPTATSVAVDRTTGRVYVGDSGAIAENQHELLKSRIGTLENGNLTRNPMGPANCAEFNSVNNALLDNAKISNLDVYTIRVADEIPYTRCANCRVTTAGINSLSD